MDRSVLAMVVPAFFLLIAAEWVAARRLGRELYRFDDGIASLATGVLQTTADFWLALWTLGSYAFVYEHARQTELPMSSPWAWVLAMLGVDFLYYWFHRASHRINLLWAAHVVHHQSEEYNLTTALRQSTLQPAYNAVFYWPLAVLGVPPDAAALLFTVDVLYQFWIHTRLIPPLGPLEYVLNTPSNHRVHHGIDPEYIDRNYGGILIIWDRLFGTYQAETTEPNFGTVKPLNSWNPLWANVAYFGTIGDRVRAASRGRDRLFAWFAPPEWRSASEGGPIAIPAVERLRRQLYRPKQHPLINGYVAAQYAWVVLALLAMMLSSTSLTQLQLVTLALWIALSAATWGGLLERKAWVRPLEYARLVITVGLGFWILAPLAWSAAAGHAVAVGVAAVWLARLDLGPDEPQG
ncbi:MAG: sterol desaturase family protein [Myxococcales bacterium]|nr:sterol desaturase family protein [Myxococcales bacterium]MDD9971677.1 sterol desaturase family protein [Myxococcales bacterium]